MGRVALVLAYVVVLFILVRPGSKGPQLVQSIGGAITSIIKGGTGGGTWAKG